MDADVQGICLIAVLSIWRERPLRARRVTEIVKLLRQAAPEAHIVIQGLLPRGSAWVGPREWKWPNRYTKPLEAVNLAYEVGRHHYTSTSSGVNATFAPWLCDLSPCF